MSKLVNRIAVAAALALAATPIIGLSAAHAGDRSQAPIARIKVGDLNLSSPAGAREFARRANIAANRACEAKGFRGLSAKACLMEFNEDLQDALSERQTADLKLARRSGADIALAAN
ncbi:UrcA family protein [Caulobacter vibrioides]|uniref:UrcA family protein n=1 Tax=Caulobacter vibrioides TaxID=155892 RepID=UPI000BB458ED|nr:UrcA family protein [Caulobacter vibrioides]ATC24071.1 UrcA family protein [Caulobacter vibrioides]AZH12318.1 UrcA family protein [Caulobacter vibrioides]PLR08496.1 UrcA family protein [Caulobacter vibrioides]